MSSFLIVLTALSLTLSASAQFGNPSNTPNAISNVVNALIVSSKRESIPKDSISGRCEFKGSSCNGATLTLKNGEEVKYSMTLTATDEFKIPNLKMNHSYSLELSWPKHGLNKMVKVSSGDFVLIQLDR